MPVKVVRSVKVATVITVAVSVETPGFIVIGCSCLEGCGFDFHYRPPVF